MLQKNGSRFQKGEKTNGNIAGAWDRVFARITLCAEQSAYLTKDRCGVYPVFHEKHFIIFQNAIYLVSQRTNYLGFPRSYCGEFASISPAMRRHAMPTNSSASEHAMEGTGLSSNKIADAGMQASTSAIRGGALENLQQMWGDNTQLVRSSFYDGIVQGNFCP